jgi:carbamoyltransferase
MTARKRSYIGLACTFHDPAIAIVDSGGDVVFAEGAERYLQDKRAINCPPDHAIRIAPLVHEYVEEDSEIVLAKTWSFDFARYYNKMTRRLRWLQRVRDWFHKDPLDGPRALDFSRTVSEAMRNNIDFAGWNVRFQLMSNWAYGAPRIAHGSPKTADSAAKLAGFGPIQETAFDHHLTHAAAGAFSSGYPDATVAVVDGWGEGTATAFFRYREGRLHELPHSRTPGSNLGFFYEMLCYMCGFDPLKGEEWKVMGLAPYGRRDDTMYRFYRSLLEIDGLHVRRKRGGGPWRPQFLELAATRDRADVAFTGQLVFEEWLFELLTNLHRICPNDRLVLGGGCGLNSSCSGKILANTPFKDLHVFCAPADDGNAVGAALLAYYRDHASERPPLRKMLPYLGSRLSSESVSMFQRFGRGPFIQRNSTDVCGETARLLAEGKIIGWAQGRAEFGPRALGNRSILADPRRQDIKNELNEKVKFREEFRPFAPSILHEFGPEYFESYTESPYMERTLKFRSEVLDRVPGVVHVDGTGRLQTVKEEWNSRYYRLIYEFYKLTGVPLLLNTSFNVMGKPIIHSVEDAIAVFMTSGLDVLVLEDLIVEKMPLPVTSRDVLASS